MKIVSKYNAFLDSVISVSEINPDAKYHLAAYDYQVECDGNILLYNNLSKTLYLLQDDEAELLKNPDSPETRKKLAPLYLDRTFIDEETDQYALTKQVAAFYDMLRTKSDRPEFIIFTTTKCNARCYYCFEHGQTQVDMTEQTASDVADYIIKQCPHKKARLKWFGGEPLYNAKVCDIICEKLRAAGIDFRSKTTTNGYLLDEAMIKRAKENWNLRSVVITLDGTRDVYNKTKNYIYDDPNPFAKVISNIDRCLESGLAVSIRLNVSPLNFDDIKTLAVFINENYGNYPKFHVVVSGLYDLAGTRSLEKRLQLDRMVKEISDLFPKSDFNTAGLNNYLEFNERCMAQSENSVVISPVGGLGQCEHFTEGEMMYGSIYSDEVNETAKNYFRVKTELPACRTCPLFPNCMGIDRCPTQTHNCDDIERGTKLRVFEYAIKNTYRKYLANGEKTLT